MQEGLYLAMPLQLKPGQQRLKRQRDIHKVFNKEEGNFGVFG